MILSVLMASCLVMGQLADPPDFSVSARLSMEGVDADAESLPRGRELNVILDVALEGEIGTAFKWEADFDPARPRRPLLFLDVPDGVRLSGSGPSQLVTPGDYQVSFLQFPFGRRLLAKSTQIPFRILKQPEAGATLGLNVVWWSGRDEHGSGSFHRERLELALTPGAVAQPGDPGDSSWGKHDTLAIGDTLPPFEAPAPDGELVDLAEVVGHQRALVIVFRRET